MAAMTRASGERNSMGRRLLNASLCRIVTRKTTALCPAALAIVIAFAAGGASFRVSGQPASAASLSPNTLKGLSWRSIGPAMFAGRVVDVAGVPGRPEILYVGAASSGLYKSVNGGTTFESIFNDGGTLSIGAIAVQPDNPDVVYVGTGEGF